MSITRKTIGEWPNIPSYSPLNSDPIGIKLLLYGYDCQLLIPDWKKVSSKNRMQIRELNLNAAITSTLNSDPIGSKLLFIWI